jgi:hypothetical protein
MPYASATPPFAAYWVTTTYNGSDPGGWQAVKHQITGASPFWTVEFRISSQTLGGWNHAVGLALFYHWWSAPNDDYSWPANGIWAAPQLWAIANLATNSVNVGASSVVPTVDGQCRTPEYSDASSIAFNTSSGTATAYLKHSAADLYVCIHNLTVPAPGQQNSPNAALYIDRSGTGGNTPNANDLSFTITYSGTVLAGSGDGSGFTGPDPGGYTVALFPYSGGWDAEFRISGATIGNWYSRTISVAVAEQNVNFAGDNYAWPAGNSFTIPNTWGQADLINLGYSAYLPIVMR